MSARWPCWEAKGKGEVMSDTTEICAQMWPEADFWHCRIIDTRVEQRTEPDGPYGYSAYRLPDLNVLIHVYWLGGLPSDFERDECQAMIVQQALEFYRTLTGEHPD
jgi:hypothetical protein